MRHDSGDSASDSGEGYEIKQTHVEDALQRINLLGVDVHIFDAANDKPLELTSFLVSKVLALRTAQRENAQLTIGAIDQMLRNVREAEALATLSAVNNEFEIFATRHKKLKGSRKPIHGRLLDAVRNRHPRTVWAATRRAGSFWNFDVYQHLGDGAAANAKARANQAIGGLREIIENKLADPAYESAHGFLGQVLADVGEWEADFVRAARHHAVTVLKPALNADDDLWEECEAQYAYVLPYKEKIAGLLSDWFDNHESLADEVDRLLERAWRTSVLKPLRTAAGTEPPARARAA
jgi:hypothetical protein